MTKVDFSQVPAVQMKEYFDSPDLLLKIHTELSKTHIGDSAEKLTVFLIACTSFLPENIRQSVALVSDSAVGKDNLQHAILKHIPRNEWIFLTSATAAVLQDDIELFRIVAFSEFNRRDKNGANYSLIESFKQLTDGGISSLKKDSRAGFKKTRHSQQAQKTVLYASCESEKDSELETRFIVVSLKTDPKKIHAVNKYTCSIFAGETRQTRDSWIRPRLENFEKDVTVIIPFARELPNLKVFDCKNPRSQRDAKRFLSLVCSIAWLHQRQRYKSSEGVIHASPFDFLSAVLICSRFFDQTYSGVPDVRVQSILDLFDEYQKENPGSEAVPRTWVKKRSGRVKNTLTKYLRILSNLGFIEFHERIGNVTYYRKGQNRVKKRFIRVTYESLLNYFKSEDYRREYIIKGQNKGSKLTNIHCDTLEKLRVTVCAEENDPLKMTLVRDNPKKSLYVFSDFPQVFLPCVRCDLKENVKFVEHLHQNLCESCYLKELETYYKEV